ncbi:MAG: hypothetical protein WBW79_02620, partial [Desulfocapsaceae bacterium]
MTNQLLGRQGAGAFPVRHGKDDRWPVVGAAGKQMTTLLARMTGHPLLGAIVTEVIQFSSVTTILVVGFVRAGLMTLAQSIDVIFGANMGPTHSDRADRVKRGHYLIF